MWKLYIRQRKAIWSNEAAHWLYVNEHLNMILFFTLCGLQVIGAFGEPIKGYGETTRRGRRQQVRYKTCILEFS